MKNKNNNLNKIINDYKDVDLEIINTNSKELSPTIKDEEYKDIEEINIDNKNELDEDDTYKDDLIVSLELTDKNNQEFKLDTTEEILELVIFEELDTMLEKEYNDIEEKVLEVDILNNYKKDEELKKEIESLEKEFNYLIDKFKELFEKYDNIYENIDYYEIIKLDDAYIKYLINDYNSFLNNDLLKGIISPTILKEYIDLINNLIEIDNKKDILEEKIDNKKEELNIDDTTIEKLKDEYLDIDNINDNISKTNNNVEKELKNIEELVKNSITIKETIEYKKKLSFSLNNVIKGNILLATSRLFPPTKKGNILRIGFMFMGINNLANVIREKEVKEVKYHYEVKDYEKDIKSNITNIEDVINNIDNAFYNIDDIRKKIKKEFNNFIDEIPEVKDLLININKLEKELNIKKEIIKNYSNEFKKALNENNEKIKKLDKYNE